MNRTLKVILLILISGLLAQSVEAEEFSIRSGLNEVTTLKHVESLNLQVFETRILPQEKELHTTLFPSLYVVGLSVNVPLSKNWTFVISAKKQKAAEYERQGSYKNVFFVGPSLRFEF